MKKEWHADTIMNLVVKEISAKVVTYVLREHACHVGTPNILVVKEINAVKEIFVAQTENVIAVEAITDHVVKTIPVARVFCAVLT